MLMGQGKTGITQEALPLSDWDSIIPMMRMGHSSTGPFASVLILFAIHARGQHTGI